LVDVPALREGTHHGLVFREVRRDPYFLLREVALDDGATFFSPDAFPERLGLLRVDPLGVGIGVEDSARDGSRHLGLRVHTPRGLVVEVRDPLPILARGVGRLAVEVEDVHQFVIFAVI
jgi:hypothetical protein